jgi:hypothetical protein
LEDDYYEQKQNGIISKKIDRFLYPANGCCKYDESNEFGGGPKLLFICILVVVLEKPAANTDAGIIAPATFRALT